MTPERWRQITEIFHGALAVGSAGRDRFVASKCGDDNVLRQEVEKMLAGHDQTGEPGEVSSARGIPDRLGHYRIVNAIGSGGMGDVYLAEDTRLERQVALKILPFEVADDPARRARFAREARAVAALNHPNIVTVHSVEEVDGVHFITMELVRGRTLAEFVQGGGVAMSKFFDIAVALSDALAAAHQQGVTHRDLKPTNIMVADDARVKILDFGLAMTTGDSGASEAATWSGTKAGQVLGTPSYMSPEQVEGRALDHRTDIFSLGIVFYEILTGERPFRGDSQAAVASAILRDAPPTLRGRRRDIHEALERIVLRCLAKAPLDRYQSALVLRYDLEEARRSAAPSSAAGDARGRRRRTAWWAALAATIAILAGVAWRPWVRDLQVREIAVLPFTLADGREDLEYLSDGITESLIQRISRLPSLTVMARSTVFNFKGKPIDPREAGRQLGVDAILTGSLSMNEGRVRISAELVEVATGAQLWGNTYDRAATEVLEIQNEIATAIVDQGIRLRLTGEERRALSSHPTTDPEAYEWYLRARHAVMGTTEEDTLQARELLTRAVRRDPQFAQAHAALAATYIAAAVDGFERPTEAFPEALRLNRRALAIDPQLPYARSVAANVAFFFEWDWAAAEREWEAIALLGAPTLPIQEFLGYASLRLILAGPAEALRVVRQYREIDPISLAYAVREADYLFHDGQMDAAASLFLKTLDVEETPDALLGLAEVRRSQRRFDEAIDLLGRAHQVDGDKSLDELLITAQGEDGYRRLELAAAQHELEALRAREATAYVSPLDIARFQAIIGNRDQAFAFLERAFSDRQPGLLFLKVDRAWDAIRDDARFAAAIRRVGLP
jgi:serine/threonine protein kinase/tetratricopeptide (TPR) repeat protein